MDKNFEEDLEKISDKTIVVKTNQYLDTFEDYFQSIDKYNSNKIRKLNIKDSNLYIFRVEPKYKIIFAAEYDKNNVLNVALLDMLEQDESDNLFQQIK